MLSKGGLICARLAALSLVSFSAAVYAADDNPPPQESTGGITESVANAVENGTVNVSFRYRYELVDADGFDKDANANTLKSRLTFAPTFNDDWSAIVEVDDVRHIGSAKFNDTRNGHDTYPGVADPKGTDLNQAALKYSGLSNSTLALGRQRINRGNQRFIGGVGWRQNEQTYDSFSAAYDDGSNFQAYYAYIYQVNRIFGPEEGSPPRKFDSKSHLIDAEYAVSDALKVSGYGYFLDFDNGDAFSNSTYGIRLSGATSITEDTKFKYTAEAARQDDYGDNPVKYDADYYRLEAGIDMAAVSINAGYEVLGGADVAGGGFRTPLATLHKFQGWADKFVGGTGAGLDSGLKDTYVGISGKALQGKLALVYHDFKADKGGSSDLGSEIDASASWSFKNHYGVLLKLARYDGKASNSDINKFWLQLTAKF